VRDGVLQRVCTIPCTDVFREGAENSARGGRAPFSISEFGLNPCARRAFGHCPRSAAVSRKRDQPQQLRQAGRLEYA
jgi:ferredoxin